MIKFKPVALLLLLPLTALWSCFAEASRGKLQETISGDFNGDGIKECAELYYSFSGDGGVDDDPVYSGCYDDYDIYFSDNSIAPLTRDILQWSASNMTNEGDLDGDGADELGVWIRGGYSSWGTYVIFAYKDSRWRDLICIDHNPNWNPCDYQELVRLNSNDPSQLIVKDIMVDGRVGERAIDITTLDNINFKYHKIILYEFNEGYVSAENNVYIDGWIEPAEGFIGWYDVWLQLSQSGCKLLNQCHGRISEYEVEKYLDTRLESSYNSSDAIVTAPDDLFFFADLDFDGVNEFITSIWPFAGSQRNCSAYTSIYRLVGGEYRDVTREFVAKCEVFDMIDPGGWSIDYTTKEIYHYNIAGVYRYVSVYKFSNGKYHYDCRVTFDYLDDDKNSFGVIEVYDCQDSLIKSVAVTKSDYETNWWDYVRYFHLQHR